MILREPVQQIKKESQPGLLNEVVLRFGISQANITQIGHVFLCFFRFFDFTQSIHYLLCILEHLLK